ncbi:MAG: hypothetical protein IJ519_05710 [Clostridia bacterium]|nr:hypothetical protein [Clostridia bacterium]
MDKLKLPSAPIPEDRLAFIPVKNVGKRSFTLAFEGDALILYGADKRYRITLTEEEK